MGGDPRGSSLYYDMLENVGHFVIVDDPARTAGFFVDRIAVGQHAPAGNGADGMKGPAKTVAAIHDLSGVGRCALTVVTPVLSVLGAQVCPVPTAVLSAHTAFSGIAVRDLTDFLPAYLAHWRALGLRFDAVYAGYLGSPRQVEIVSDFLKSRKPPSRCSIR